MEKQSSGLKQVVNNGLLGGIISLLLALVGMVNAFGKSYIVSDVITMAQVLMLAPILILGYNAVTRSQSKSTVVLLGSGLLAGLVGGLVLAVFIEIGQVVNLRAMLINASPDLYKLLTFGLPIQLGVLMLVLASVVSGGIAVGIYLLPARLRRAVVQAFLWVSVLGLLRNLFVTMIEGWGPVKALFRWMFAASGVTPFAAVVIFLVIGVIFYWTGGTPATKSKRQLTTRQQRTARLSAILGIILIVLFLPRVLGIFFSEILDNVGLFILMGLGLNIVVGFAGLLDLGYVAFYAIGAYTMGVLTSPELGFFNLTFWQALPFALVTAVLSGVLLGLPVLKMRGDYLAIVTLGFGEIIRLLVLSDWLRPYLGGTQGIQQIAHPMIGSLEIANQQQLYYLIIVAIGITAFIAWRLKDSRLGRAWMALREDEDVAKAMGINHVTTKLMAFAMGALFSGLAGAIFATKLTSTYPQSFQFLVSINVLSLIIIGGMGSIPGVLVGGLVFMGAPELLREFAEFRYLVYGALMVAMMLIRPEGLWPEARRRLELHEAEEPIEDEIPQDVIQDSGL